MQYLAYIQYWLSTYYLLALFQARRLEQHIKYTMHFMSRSSYFRWENQKTNKQMNNHLFLRGGVCSMMSAMKTMNFY